MSKLSKWGTMISSTVVFEICRGRDRVEIYCLTLLRSDYLRFTRLYKITSLIKKYNSIKTNKHNSFMCFNLNFKYTFLFTCNRHNSIIQDNINTKTKYEFEYATKEHVRPACVHNGQSLPNNKSFWLNKGNLPRNANIKNIYLQ